MYPFEHLHHAARSDLGLVRGNNEDAFGGFPEAGVFCVADGMGGGDDGEFASAETVAALSEFCGQLHTAPDCGHSAAVLSMGISAALNRASASIVRHTAEHGLKACGSTFVGVVFDATAPDTAIALHAGDSRLYRYRNGTLLRVTRDHSVAELMGVADEREVDKKLRGVIVRAVGAQETVDLERNAFDVQTGDRIFLCSDGLSRMVPDTALTDILSSVHSTENAVDEMVEAAKRGGGLDNITVMLIDVGDLPPPLRALQDDPLPTSLEVCETGEEHGDRKRRMEVRSPRRRSGAVVLLSGMTVLLLATASWFVHSTARAEKKAVLSAAGELAASCDGETVRRFMRVVRRLDRHGVPDGFEATARGLAASVSSGTAETLAREVLLAVKSGVDYARDCSELKESLHDPNTERLRRLFAALAPELDGNPGDAATQRRCAALIREVAGWD